ncbi:hypothetical protein [Mesorhizobium sp. B2-6-1]|uniref:hypothetical protein n=1 Tax=Mesorhizobium sp. B2-6-1 TaxID=2589916 RepID=UPI0015E2FF89|nr:hypothetical protein [Mesorhizobium sp. B2-6-1]
MNGFDAAFGGASHEVLDLGEQLFDEIDVWLQGGRKKWSAPLRPDRVKPLF